MNPQVGSRIAAPEAGIFVDRRPGRPARRRSRRSGLGRPRKRDGYVGRQLRTCTSPGWPQSSRPSTTTRVRTRCRSSFSTTCHARDPPDRSRRLRPAQHPDRSRLHHRCVVDWEISTLGDPLADLAYALNWFPDPADAEPPRPEAATTAPGSLRAPPDGALRRAHRPRPVAPRLLHRLQPLEIGGDLLRVYARYMEGKKSAGPLVPIMFQRLLNLPPTSATNTTSHPCATSCTAGHPARPR